MTANPVTKSDREERRGSELLYESEKSKVILPHGAFPEVSRHSPRLFLGYFQKDLLNIFLLLFPLRSKKLRKWLPEPSTQSRKWVRYDSGLILTLILMGGVGSCGFVFGEYYDRFVSGQGSLSHALSWFVGFPIEKIQIQGHQALGTHHILNLVAFDPEESLLFLDVEKIRKKLEALSSIRQVFVTKIYPDALRIQVVEHSPYALWQKNGHIYIIAADGTVLEDFPESSISGLPFVVGEKANEHVQEFVGLAQLAEALPSKIQAGLFISQRRWTLKLQNGIEIKLPEQAPQKALKDFLSLERTAHVLERDLTQVDLRRPGWVVVRLSAKAAELWAMKDPAKSSTTKESNLKGDLRGTGR